MPGGVSLVAKHQNNGFKVGYKLEVYLLQRTSVFKRLQMWVIDQSCQFLSKCFLSLQEAISMPPSMMKTYIGILFVLS